MFPKTHTMIACAKILITQKKNNALHNLNIIMKSYENRKTFLEKLKQLFL